jgi:hypothetical protein
MTHLIEIIDNRNGQAELEIDSEGYGRWYAHNPISRLIIACKYKSQAKDIQRNPESWDI